MLLAAALPRHVIAPAAGVVWYDGVLPMLMLENKNALLTAPVVAGARFGPARRAGDSQQIDPLT